MIDVPVAHQTRNRGSDGEGVGIGDEKESARSFQRRGVEGDLGDRANASEDHDIHYASEGVEADSGDERTAEPDECGR